MKKLTTLLFFVVLTTFCIAQAPPGHTPISSTRYWWKIGGAFDELELPAKAGPPTFITGQWFREGAVYVDSSAHKAYLWLNHTWVEVGTSGGGGTSTTDCRITGPYTIVGLHDLAFYVSPFTFLLNGVSYNFPGGEITADDGDADPGEFRRDAIFIDATNTLGIEKGVNSTGGVAAFPELPPCEKLLVGNIRIDEEATIPTGVTQVMIRDNADAGEWTPGGTATRNDAYATNPDGGSGISQRITNMTNGQYLSWTDPVAGHYTSKSQYPTFSVRIRNNTAINPQLILSIRLYKDGVPLTGSLPVGIKQQGWDITTLSSYMTVAFPTSLFSGSDEFNEVRLIASLLSGSAATDIQVDKVKVQAGISIASPEPAYAIVKTDNGDAVATTPNDAFELKGYGNVKTKAIGKKVTVDGSAFILNSASKNYVNDSILVYTADVTANTAGNSWTKGSNYNSNTTESVVSDGIQIVNTSSGSIAADASIFSAWSPWKSSSNDVTIRAIFKVNSINSDSKIGVMMKSVQALSVEENAFYFDLTTANLFDWYWVGTVTPATTGNFITAIGDTIIVTATRSKVQKFNISVYNVTQNKGFDYERWPVFPSGNTSMSNISPGIFVYNLSTTLQSFKYYSNKYNPDIVLVGDSRTASSKRITYDSTREGWLNRISNRKVLLTGHYGATIADIAATEEEIFKIKPKAAIIDIGLVDVQLTPASTWRTEHKALVDAFISQGIKTIVVKSFPKPTDSTGLTMFNNFIDSLYGSYPTVYILNLFNTTPMYKFDEAGDGDPAYYVGDGIHQNQAGERVLAQYTASKLDSIFNTKPGTGGGLLPDQTGHNGEALYTDGTTPSWQSVGLASTDLSDMPNDLTGQSGKVLAVKGTEDGYELVPNSATNGLQEVTDINKISTNDITVESVRVRPAAIVNNLASLSYNTNLTNYEGKLNLTSWSASGSGFNVSLKSVLTITGVRTHQLQDKNDTLAGLDDIRSQVAAGNGNTLLNIGSGRRLAQFGTMNVKTLFTDPTLSLDSTTNTNGITFRVDTTAMQTKGLSRFKIDSLAAAISVNSTNISSNTTSIATKLDKDIDALVYTALGGKVVAETVGFPLLRCNQTRTLVDGTMNFVGIYVTKADVMTGLEVYPVATGSYTGDNNNKGCLYSYNTGSGLLTKIAESTNSATLWTATANVNQLIPFSSTVSLTPGVYFGAIIYNNSVQVIAPGVAMGTAPGNAGQSGQDFTNSAKLYGSVTGQTDCPATINMSAITTGTVPVWMGIYK